jgi:hypothetical protein
MMAVASGRKTVATVGEAERISTVPLQVTHVDIFALDVNTDRVHVGDKNVRAATGMESGWPLSAKESVTFTNVDLMDIWLDAAVAGEGVSWGAEY